MEIYIYISCSAFQRDIIRFNNDGILYIYRERRGEDINKNVGYILPLPHIYNSINNNIILFDEVLSKDKICYIEILHFVIQLPIKVVLAILSKVNKNCFNNEFVDKIFH